MNYQSAIPYFYGTGRRKSSVARVRVMAGTGNVTVNGKNIDEYFGLETLKLIVNQPFAVTKTAGTFDVICTVKGGGVSGQAGAIRHVFPSDERRLLGTGCHCRQIKGNTDGKVSG